MFWFLSSFFIVALAQPDWSPLCCILAAAIGYALFWKGLLQFTTKKARFLMALLWFGSVEVVHLSWFTADRYVGSFIYLFLFLLFLSLGSLFGLLSLFVQEPKRMHIVRILGIAGGWTLLEWLRLFLLSGFSWNPVGLALTGTLYGMQMASIVGVFGLTFWIFFTNLMGLRLFTHPFPWAYAALFAVVALTPYLFGFAQVSFHDRQMKLFPSPSLSIVLVQTSLSPEQKIAYTPSVIPFTPHEQWEKILLLLKKHQGKEVDLIVFPETVVPYGTDFPIYTEESVLSAFNKIFGTQFTWEGKKKVGNSYWSQLLANFFGADVIIGLEDSAPEEMGCEPAEYNAGFLFSPLSNTRCRYEKRVLVPLGEYIPFNWCRSFLAKYGISDFFRPGSEAKVFMGKRCKMGMSICYEETFGHLMRESRLKGASLLVNLSNDVWYPHSRLPLVHFLHGRVRSVECGIPVVRSCNTGVTCGIDCIGRIVGALDFDREGADASADSLHLYLSSYHYPTLYTHLGDGLIVVLSLIAVIFALYRYPSK